MYDVNNAINIYFYILERTHALSFFLTKIANDENLIFKSEPKVSAFYELILKLALITFIIRHLFISCYMNII